MRRAVRGEAAEGPGGRGGGTDRTEPGCWTVWSRGMTSAGFRSLKVVLMALLRTELRGEVVSMDQSGSQDREEALRDLGQEVVGGG